MLAGGLVLPLEQLCVRSLENCKDLSSMELSTGSPALVSYFGVWDSRSAKRGGLLLATSG